MDLIDNLTQLASRIISQKESVRTEEGAKTAFVLPFLQALGYDIFNPDEVVPELVADHSIKKGEKVDYGVKQDGKIVMLIECKAVGADLSTKYAAQLFRYFSVTDARFGVLTDGIKYIFFSDLEKENKMDDRPFFVFDMLNFGESEVTELKKFTKNKFDLETIIGTASNLKFHRALIQEISKEFSNPTEDIVKIFTSRVYSGRFTHQVRDQFSELVKKAFEGYIRDTVNARLKTALDSGQEDANQPAPVIIASSASDAPVSDVITKNDGIVTTEEEIEAHKIIQAIGAEIIDVDRIVMRDSKTYCAILMDDNNRKPITRLYFLKTKMSIVIFYDSQEERVEIEKVSDIYTYKDKIKKAISQYIDND